MAQVHNGLSVKISAVRKRTIRRRNKLRRVTLASLKWRSRLPLRDGSRTQYVSYVIGGTIDQAGKKSSGKYHKAQETYGIEYFISCGYRVFPKHIGLSEVAGWADFAVARGRRVILVECLTDWWSGSLERKAELIVACELWFITEGGYMSELRKRGYKCKLLPCPKTPDFLDLNSQFWICRPRTAKDL
jgi:hypothetical protein